MLFPTLLISAIAAVPAPQNDPITAQGTHFYTTGVLTRGVRNFGVGNLVEGDCGLTKYQQLGKDHPEVPTLKFSRTEAQRDFTFRFTKVDARQALQAQAKIMITAPNSEAGFPNFGDSSAQATEVIEVPADQPSTVFTLDLTKFMGEFAGAYAWIQVVAFKNQQPLEKHCYPVHILKE